ncbi:hypothetical protein PENNAL_c0172G09561, partial [Penicillium nalgiovense]
MEAHFAPRDAGQNTGIRGCRKDLARYGDTRLAPDQPFRSPKATVRGVGAGALARADLHSVAWPTGVEEWKREAYQLTCSDLVQRQIDSQGGAVAFVDDFTAWVTGSTAQSNREGIEAIINEALDWEKRSGAIFEAEKTAIIHFAPQTRKSDHDPFTFKGQAVVPQDHVEILGLLMNTRLKYKEHIARAASKGLEAAMELRRLRGLTPASARQLFTSTVAPVVDYASNVWMHACKDRAMGPINRVQRVGAQALVGTFLTVATRVAEAEAHIATAQHRFWRRALK